MKSKQNNRVVDINTEFDRLKKIFKKNKRNILTFTFCPMLAITSLRREVAV